MANNQASNMTHEFEQELDNLINEDIDSPEIPVQPETEIKEPVAPVAQIPLEEEKPTPETPATTEIATEPTAFDLEIEDDQPAAAGTEPDWATIGREMGFDAKGKEDVVKNINTLKQEYQALKAEQEKVQSYSAVSDTVEQIDKWLSMDAEALIRFRLKEIEGWDDDDIEARVQKLIDNDTLQDEYLKEKYELKKVRKQTLDNAVNYQNQQKQATIAKQAEFTNTAIEAIKTHSNILGLSLSPENLTKAHSRAERLIGSKEFQDKLKDPKYVAELAFRESVWGSLGKMLESKYKNQAKSEIIKDFGQPSRSTASGVERPAHIEAMNETKSEMEKFLESEKFTIGG